MPPTLVPVRVTVLGGNQVGKTSLICGFVNNFVPDVHVSTEDAVLYYKTLEIPHLDTNGEQCDPFLVLVEVEDTYSWERQGGDSDFDAYGRPRDAKSFASADGGTKKALKSNMPLRHKVCQGQLRLMEPYGPPRVDSYRPIAHTRMAYFVVFDPTNKRTFEDAKEIVDKIQREWHHARVKPVIFLVANKLDLVMDNEEHHLVREAQRFATDFNVKFDKLSSKDLQLVRRLFRRALVEVKEAPKLWNEEFPPGWSPPTGREVMGPTQSKTTATHGRSPAAAPSQSTSDCTLQ